MPWRTRKPCSWPGCSELTSGSYCAGHSRQAPKQQDRRPSSSVRGYGRTWRRVRERTLRAHGIPPDRWPLYAVDHNPPYDPEIDPNHNHYTLIPRLIAEHNRKTATVDTKRDELGRFSGKGAGG